MMWYFEWDWAMIMLARLGIAALLGGIIGLEREKARRNAGLRTHILVALGASLIMCTGEMIFLAHAGKSNIDPARMGAQVVSGIGILCAGAIMKEGATIRGLTTSTGLWCASCIGIAAGSGNIIPAAGATLIVVIVLWFFRNLEERRLGKNESTELIITAKNAESVVAHILNLMLNTGYEVDALRFAQGQNDEIILSCSVCLQRNQTEADLVSRLSEIREITAIERQ